MAGIVEREPQGIAAAGPHREHGRRNAINFLMGHTFNAGATRPKITAPFEPSERDRVRTCERCVERMRGRRAVLFPANSTVIAVAFPEPAVLRMADESAVAHPHGLAIVACA